MVFCHPNTEGIIFKIRVTRRTCTRDPEYIIQSPFVAEIIFTEVSRQFHGLFPAPQHVGLIREYWHSEDTTLQIRTNLLKKILSIYLLMFFKMNPFFFTQLNFITKILNACEFNLPGKVIQKIYINSIMSHNHRKSQNIQMIVLDTIFYPSYPITCIKILMIIKLCANVKIVKLNYEKHMKTLFYR